ncbi:A24 family peptidase [Arthrobacter sp. I2-34]|uniref:A24 family peptidase n=1 Tax=Arthrobacter hankyongi TaxID=2904801 RepID=A0ABS9L4L2_9MICC|nr:A24 family peptidase [Arthrobacter hankyongi]MCG2621617.1 A24 family peptidase [Arthrobacter hankyongi]
MFIPLFASCTLAGLIAGWYVFPLAQREERTALPPGWRITTAALTGAAGGLLAWVAGPSWAIPAFLLLAVLGVLLAAIDARHKLLPNRLVAPFLLGALLLLAAACLITGDWDRLLGGILGGAGLFAVYLALALIRPGGIGMGDVKLAAVVGLYAGYLGFSSWLFVLMAAFLLSAVAGVTLLLARRATRNSEIPFGPAMILASLLAPALPYS